MKLGPAAASASKSENTLGGGGGGEKGPCSVMSVIQVSSAGATMMFPGWTFTMQGSFSKRSNRAPISVMFEPLPHAYLLEFPLN